jgi:N-acyl-D-aspartate/D-glutamate deacylase
VPKRALDEGLDVTWTTFGGYLDAVTRPLALNIGFFVGHSALRRTVMGAEGSGQRATPEEIESMKRLLAESLRAGGLGFSTSLQRTHVDADNAPTPAHAASYQELIELASMCGQHAGTMLQATPETMNYGVLDDERALLIEMSRVADRRMFWSMIKIAKDVPDLHERGLRLHDEAIAAGGRLCGLTFINEGISNRKDWSNPYLMRANPAPWPHFMDLPSDELSIELRKPETRRLLLDALLTPGHALGAGFDHRWGEHEINDVADPTLQHYVGKRVHEIAAARGIGDFDAMLDVALEGNLEVGFVLHDEGTTGRRDPWVRARRIELLHDPRVIWGANDSGAHTDTISGASFPSRAVDELVRKEKSFTLEEVVHRLTDHQAESFGIRDRGRVEEGLVADLAVFDADTFAPTRMEQRRDWPGGAWHLVSEAVGMHHVFVAGRPVVEGGEYTGEMPGKVMRSGVDTRTLTAR